MYAWTVRLVHTVDVDIVDCKFIFDNSNQLFVKMSHAENEDGLEEKSLPIVATCATVLECFGYLDQLIRKFTEI